jgi:hypothetical protein
MQLSNGRGSRIRTCGPLLPKQVLYQAELCPDVSKINELLGFACPLALAVCSGRAPCCL